MMGLGLDMRAVRDQGTDYQSQTSPSIAFGAGYRQWLGMLEYSRYQGPSNGNGALNITGSNETAMLWGQWYAREKWSLRPFVGVGVGAYHEMATTSLYSESRTDVSDWREMFGGAVGLRLVNVSPLWLSLEGRVLFSPNLDPNPMFAGMLRIGFTLD
jgi:hypothetical protein